MTWGSKVYCIKIKGYEYCKNRAYPDCKRMTPKSSQDLMVSMPNQQACLIIIGGFSHKREMAPLSNLPLEKTDWPRSNMILIVSYLIDVSRNQNPCLNQTNRQTLKIFLILTNQIRKLEVTKDNNCWSIQFQILW